MQNKIAMASDNWAPVHPAIMQALEAANDTSLPAYGNDAWTAHAQHLIQNAFQRPCKVHFVPTGTGGNVLALMLSCQRHESVICTDIAHIHYQESGAAEAIIGCKLLTIPHHNGKITCEAVVKKLQSERAFGKHSTLPRVVSIAQPTEVGTLYTLDELKSLLQLCREEGLLLHVDGSRLYNALAALKIGFHELPDIDILSLGGTKNGLMGAEALVIFEPRLQNGSDHLQKQTLQLMSKMRYLSAQYVELFNNELWRSLANHANQKAKEIAGIIQALPGCRLSYPVETNQIFFQVPASWIPELQERISCHLWDHTKHELRFITSWNTSAEDVLQVRQILAR